MSHRKARYCLMSVLALLIPAVAPAADSLSPQGQPDDPLLAALQPVEEVRERIVERHGDVMHVPVRPRQTCAADFNGDRRVDVLDLIELLMSYGLCPDDQAPEFGPTDQVPEFGPTDQAPEFGPSDNTGDLDKNRDARDDRARSPDASDSDADQPVAIGCVGDLNNDGAVDRIDLIALLSDYGSVCP